ncbi:transcriptional regulator [Wenzhouxiangella sp. XN201]|uniref:winged helix-turn-helix domain-containing protein n=1 Tax=Wenzhouxiangella sp. XN201 TaxID=2710755 RepID=UPI0013C9D46D|nr:transcriptional regulator [Wenzhouxiangella sp. XN201]NEZ03569.1 transcriptional regulator [Wenzhouxiangella sp. XN201]
MVAKGQSAKHTAVHEQEGDTCATPARRSKGIARSIPVQFNRVIHERVRLAIVSVLAGAESMSFNDLKRLLDITDGNLSVHARRLEEAGFVTCEKSFVGRVPHTEYRLTKAGRKALNEYLDHMESLISRVRKG